MSLRIKVNGRTVIVDELDLEGQDVKFTGRRAKLTSRTRSTEARLRIVKATADDAFDLGLLALRCR